MDTFGSDTQFFLASIGDIFDILLSVISNQKSQKRLFQIFIHSRVGITNAYKPEFLLLFVIFTISKLIFKCFNSIFIYLYTTTIMLGTNNCW